MSSSTYESHLATCPYYHRESGYTVQCDGWQERQTLTVTFSGKGECGRHKKKFCRDTGEGYKACPLFSFITGNMKDEK